MIESAFKPYGYRLVSRERVRRRRGELTTDQGIMSGQWLAGS